MYFTHDNVRDKVCESLFLGNGFQRLICPVSTFKLGPDVLSFGDESCVSRFLVNYSVGK